jgi:hypothetical protein
VALLQSREPPKEIGLCDEDGNVFATAALTDVDVQRMVDYLKERRQ